MHNLAVLRRKGNTPVIPGAPDILGPERIILRDYQEDGLNLVRAAFGAGRRSVLLVAPTGAGKGTLAAYTLSQAAQKGSHSLFVVHRKEIIRDVHKRMRRAGAPCGMIIPGEPYEPDALIQVCSIQTLFARGVRPPADFVFWDECFPAGTLVDGRPIETLREGDSVSAYDAANTTITTGKVVKTFRSRPSAMVRVVLSDGRALPCTPGHPFYIVDEDDYVAASDLGPGDRLREKQPTTALLQVVRVEVVPHTLDGTFGGVCPDGFVYNIEVERHHNYFAENILVHNCHHAVAKSYRQVREAYPRAKHLGATATPMRADRTALGDVFEEMIVIATTSELTERRFLVPCATFAPDRSLGDNLAQDPVSAYLAHGNGERAFVFVERTGMAKELAERFSAMGIPAATIDGKTPDAVRRRSLVLFREGHVRVIVNVATMTEGIDVPEAKVCILGSKCATPAVFLQKCGRVLRPSEGLARPGELAILIDLCGNIHAHGLPGDDRTFSLTGKAITNTEIDKDDNEPYSCPAGCGASVRPTHVMESGPGCPRCGWKKLPKPMAEILGERLHVYGDQLDLPFAAGYA